MGELISQARSLRSNADWQSVGGTVASTQPGTSSQAAKPPTSSITSAAEQVDFVIITALEEERDAMLSKLPGYKRLKPSDADIRTYYKATVEVGSADDAPLIYNVVLTTLLSMGRVQATTITSDAIRRWRPRYVLLVGIAGGIAEKGV